MPSDGNASSEKINNEFYDKGEDTWWDEDTPMYLLNVGMNPLRAGYFKRVFETLGLKPEGKRALEIGSGGGVLTEEIRRMGFETSGIEPSEHSVHTAEEHARLHHTKIQYTIGSGERLPYADASFDVVFCCDVLEHVKDLPAVIAETARVLKPGGIFCFDTINRTLLSKLVVVKIAQDLKSLSFMPRNLHVWSMFIRPKELKRLMQDNGLDCKELRGAKPGCSIISLLRNLRKRKKGLINFKQLGETLQLKEGPSTRIFYMGHAVKNF